MTTKQAEPAAAKQAEADPTTTDDFKDWLAIMTVSGNIEKDIDIGKLSKAKRADLIGRFNAWLSADKPRPTMPDLKPEHKQVVRLGRVRYLGKEYLYYVTAGEAVPTGVKMIPEYRKYTDDNGKTVEDTDVVIAWEKEYTIPYTDELAREMVERCLNESPKPSFTFVDGDKNYHISEPDNFTGSFTEILRQHRKGEYV